MIPTYRPNVCIGPHESRLSGAGLGTAYFQNNHVERLNQKQHREGPGI